MWLKIYTSFLLVFVTVDARCAKPDYQCSITPCWHVLTTPQSGAIRAPWVHVATIAIKKKALEHVHVDEIAFVWNGKKITHISASLYKKSSDQPFVALEKNFIGDGQWSNKGQKLLFHFNEPIHLEVMNEFCIICQVPKALQFLLTKGFFELDRTNLPNPLAGALRDTSVLLDFRQIDFSSLS